MPLANESPLKQYCDNFDLKHIDWGSEQYENYALKKITTKQINSLLIKDWEWRANHKQNIIASISGSQGTGKSLPFLYACCLAGNAFGVPFTKENIYFSIEELNNAVKTVPDRSILMKDEHRHTSVGIMSSMQGSVLADFVEQIRYPRQLCLFFTSVTQREHADFFRFESKNIDWSKDGSVPLGFYAMLFTPRYTGYHEFVCRGLVYFPMPDMDLINAYEKKKAEHIGLLENSYSNTLGELGIDVEKLIKLHFSDLVYKNTKGLVRPVNRELMFVVLYSVLGTSKYTTEGYKLLQASLRVAVQKKCAETNFSDNIE